MNFPTLTIRCPACHGSGVVMNWLGSKVLCPRCDGAGRVPMRVRRTKYDYALPSFLSSAGNSVQSQQLQLDGDAPFEQTGWALATTVGVGSFAGSASAGQIQLFDLSTGWQFSNNPVPLVNFASQLSAVQGGGTVLLGAAFPVPLVAPYIWMPSATVQATLTWPFSTLAQYTIQLVMKGFKLYAPDGSPLNLSTQASQPAQQAAAA